MAFFKSAKISIIGSSKWLSFCRGYMLPSRNYRILKICLFLMPGITPGRLAHPLAADVTFDQSSIQLGYIVTMLTLTPVNEVSPLECRQIL